MFTFYPNTYFFTATINSWRPLLENEERKNIVLECFKFLCLEKRILLHGFVIMPNHFHLILTLPEGENQSKIQTSLLRFCSHRLVKHLLFQNDLTELSNYLSTQNDRVYHIWERRPLWKHLENTLIVEQKLKYIHNNPIYGKWSLCDSIEDYPWSSASFYLKGESRFDFLSPIFD